ncbi:MAG: hypothetical protein PVI26_08475 [Chitinispirillia bacterium]|jgi:tetratricopeptide (TPR) repeat protein
MKINTSLYTVIITLTFLVYCSCAGFKNLSRNNLKCIKKCSNEQNVSLEIKCLSNSINKNPTYSEYYLLRGSAYIKLMKFTTAIHDFRKVIELEPGNVDGYYRLAAAASLATYKQYALYWLQRCFEAGFTNYQLIENDNNFDILRETDEFKTLLKKWYQKPVSLN